MRATYILKRMLGLVTEYLQCDTCISGKNTPETLKYL